MALSRERVVEKFTSAYFESFLEHVSMDTVVSPPPTDKHGVYANKLAVLKFMHTVWDEVQLVLGHEVHWNEVINVINTYYDLHYPYVDLTDGEVHGVDNVAEYARFGNRIASIVFAGDFGWREVPYRPSRQPRSSTVLEDLAKNQALPDTYAPILDANPDWQRVATGAEVSALNRLNFGFEDIQPETTNCPGDVVVRALLRFLGAKDEAHEFRGCGRSATIIKKEDMDSTEGDMAIKAFLLSMSEDHSLESLTHVVKTYYAHDTPLTLQHTQVLADATDRDIIITIDKDLRGNAVSSRVHQTAIFGGNEAAAALATNLLSTKKLELVLDGFFSNDELFGVDSIGQVLDEVLRLAESVVHPPSDTPPGGRTLSERLIKFAKEDSNIPQDHAAKHFFSLVEDDILQHKAQALWKYIDPRNENNPRLKQDLQNAISYTQNDRLTFNWGHAVAKARKHAMNNPIAVSPDPQQAINLPRAALGIFSNNYWESAASLLPLSNGLLNGLVIAANPMHFEPAHSHSMPIADARVMADVWNGVVTKQALRKYDAQQFYHNAKQFKEAIGDEEKARDPRIMEEIQTSFNLHMLATGLLLMFVTGLYLGKRRLVAAAVAGYTIYIRLEYAGIALKYASVPLIFSLLRTWYRNGEDAKENRRRSEADIPRILDMRAEELDIGVQLEREPVGTVARLQKEERVQALRYEIERLVALMPTDLMHDTNERLRQVRVEHHLRVPRLRDEAGDPLPRLHEQPLPQRYEAGDPLLQLDEQPLPQRYEAGDPLLQLDDQPLPQRYEAGDPLPRLDEQPPPQRYEARDPLPRLDEQPLPQVRNQINQVAHADPRRQHRVVAMEEVTHVAQSGARKKAGKKRAHSKTSSTGGGSQAINTQITGKRKGPEGLNADSKKRRSDDLRSVLHSG